jgi:hypothetical protein
MSVTNQNADEMRYIQYLVRKKKKTSFQSIKKSNKKRRPFYKFKVGDPVRISQLKRVFEKGYQENWTLEYFKIAKRYKRDNQYIYTLKDTLGDEICGTFYRYELQKIDKADTEMYKIETNH